MNGNKQTGLTHLHVYTFVIYRMERGTVACILITACRSLRKIHGNSSHAFSVNLWRHIRMDAYTRTLRFNHNPLNLILGAEKKKGLRIGYMEAGLQGFYLNSMETGIHPQKLSKLLTEEFHCTDNESATGLFQFLINEGDRVSYQIMLPLFALYREHQRVRKHHSKAFFRSGTLYPSRKESIQICEIYRGKKGPYYMDK